MPQFVNSLSSNVISLKDLADGTWLWRKTQKTQIHKKCKNKMLKRQKQQNKMLTKKKVTHDFYII